VRIYTIGYEGFGIDEWVTRLHEAGVQLVVDVRELPLSRRPGFSKRKLAERLAAEGIDYVSVRALGSPPELRAPLKRGTLTFAEFAPRFREVLAEREPELREVLRLAQQRSAVLVCWEEDPARCHRSLVADALRRLAEESLREPLEVVDIRRWERTFTSPPDGRAPCGS